KGFGYWDGVSDQIIFFNHPEAHLPDSRFNDGAVGPAGNFWAGTMYQGLATDRPAPGSLYRLHPDENVRLIQPDLTISNGLGWSPDKTRFYHTDTLHHTIYRYDFDPVRGEASNRRVFVHDLDQPGVPDGLTVDSQGFVWSARWGGWKITRYDPDGIPERGIELPVECPTSCTFGGADLNQLYITSAWTALTPEQRTVQPQAGDLFRIEFNDITGQPANHFLG
ncbi:MAG: SMP-30/gluconolactonase/LRE family protein, partial [Chloroflexota bacterium]